jgi:hypothetical protein
LLRRYGILVGVLDAGFVTGLGAEAAPLLTDRHGAHLGRKVASSSNDGRQWEESANCVEKLSLIVRAEVDLAEQSGGPYTATANSVAGYAYSDNYLIDLKHAVIMDVEATAAIRQAEVGAAKTMLDRTAQQFDVTPSRLVLDGGYGSAEMVGWPADERGIEPHVKPIDKAERTDGTFSRSDFAYNPEGNFYVSPAPPPSQTACTADRSRENGWKTSNDREPRHRAPIDENQR